MSSLFNKTLHILLLVFICKNNYCQDVVINELMSSNSSVIQDKDGDFSDWIELYNPTDLSINLANYGLSDDDDQLNKWILPRVVLSPKEFILIFASGKDIYEYNEIHTNFKISSKGESIYLSNPDGEIISSTKDIAIPENKSYGCIRDGGNEYGIFDSPTPMETNANSPQIHTSHTSGFFKDQIQLKLTPSNNDISIYYTLNGETPTEKSIKYSKPIEIKNISKAKSSFSNIPTTPLEGPWPLPKFMWKDPTKVYKTNIVRYAGFKDGKMQGEVKTKTFFIDKRVNKKYTFPIISLTTDSLNLFDYDTGIYIPGKRFDLEGFNWWPIGNYLSRGIDWERNVHFSFFESDGTLGFETNAGIRMRGFSSTSYPQKSFGIFFRKDYGLKNTDYPIFKNYDPKKHKRLILRNSGNDFLDSHFKDAVLQKILEPMKLDLQFFQPSVLFLNGEYWGIYNIREKYDKYYFKYKYGIEEDNINVLGICATVEEGKNDDYVELVDFIEKNDISKSKNYAHVQEKIDIDNFIDFIIAEVYYANYDWPCNNYKKWKTNDPDSKWRYLIYDLDFSFGYGTSPFNKPSLDHAVKVESGWPHCSCSNLIFRNLLKNQEFKEKLIEKFAYHLNNTFKSSVVVDEINSFQELFRPEIEEHIDRWGYPSSVSDWDEKIEVMRNFALKRPCYIAKHIKSFFNLSSFDFECDGPTDFNTSRINIGPNPNNGNFFIKNESSEQITGDIVISSADGQILYSESNIKLEKYEKYYFDLSKFSNGTYLLNFKTLHFTESKRLVILK